MRSLPARYDAAQVEADVGAFWKSRSLPPTPSPYGRGAGAPVHQVVPGLAATDTLLSFLLRALRADAEARFLSLQGRPSRGRLIARRTDHPALAALRLTLPAHAVWVGGGALAGLATERHAPELQELVDRLASSGLLISREGPLRSCPACRAPRSPEGLVYSAEDGDAYLVRFLVDGPAPRTSLLVWIDSTWKLLGTSAVLLHPDLPYVRVRFRRRGTEEIVLVLRSAVDRLRSWLGGSEIEILEEKKGSELVGTRYLHPLATEFPTLSSLPPPAGQVAASAEVDDSGTGIVALVPAHGAGDAAVAAQLGVPGWPVVGPDGQLVRDLQHKYAGLPVDVAEAFVLRDLGESGLLFAQLRVRRGLPMCAVCGTALYWQPSRAWCLDLGAATGTVREQLLHLVPADGLPKADEPVAWPVSEWRTTDAPGAPRLLECVQCGRLAPVRAGPERCPCGANWKAVARRLLPSFEEPLDSWARDRPFAPGDPVRFYVAERRKGPTTILQAVAAFAAATQPGDVRTVGLPSLPFDGDLGTTPPGGPADGLRSALLRTGAPPRAGDPALADRRRQEERRLRKIWQVAREVVDACLRDGFEYDPRPIAGRLPDLLEEDRAFLSLFERMRTEAQRLYESGALPQAQELLVRFFEEELRDGYLPMARLRLEPAGASAGKVAAYRVLAYVVPLWAELYAPIAPFTMEAIHRAFRGDATSLFERTVTPGEELLLDSQREQSYARWRSVLASLEAVRSELGLAADARIPSIVLVVGDDAVAAQIKAERAVLERLGRVDRVEVGSPSQPWDGKRVRSRPIPEEIQKAYPFQQGRVLRMLEGMNPTRVQEALRTRTLELVLEGHPLPITPSMIEITESLADGVLPAAWSQGDLFITLPTDLPSQGRSARPALSPDGLRLLATLRRRIERSPAPSTVDRVEIFATGTLAEEVTKHLVELSQHLQGVEIVLASEPGRFEVTETTHGRSQRGARWAIWIPGLAVPRKSFSHSARARHARRRPVGQPIVEDVGTDYLDEGLRARETAIRDAVEAFDHALGRPIVGPAKLSAAWESGLTSFDAVAHAPYERLVDVPGFGPVVAAAVVRGFGGTPPSRVRPARTVSSGPESARTASTQQDLTSPAGLPEMPGPTAPPLPVQFVPSRPATAPAPLPPSVRIVPEVSAAEESTPTAPESDDGVPPPGPVVDEIVPAEPAPETVPLTPTAAPATGPAAGPISAPEPQVPPPPRPAVAPTPRPAPPGAGTTIPEPAPLPSAPAAAPAPTGVEVWSAASADRPWAAFLELTELGSPGLCLSREFPERLRTFLGSRNVRIVWLSNVGREGSVRPGDLDSLRGLFRGFLGGGPGRVAYIEGVEYLVRIHGTARTLEFLHELHALAGESSARLFLPINPALMDPDAADRLTAEFPVAA